MSAKYLPAKSPPYILLWMARLFAIFTVAITATIILARAVRTGYNCLLINGDPETDLLDVRSGLHFNIPLLPQDQLPAYGYYWPSPDGRYLAHLEPNDNVATASPQMVIQPFNPPIPAAQRRNLMEQIAIIDTTIDEASWSPDGHWIAYHWQTSDGQNYLAVQDANGKYQQIRKLQSQAGEAIQFNDWSPDSRFIAVLNRDNNTRSARISFWANITRSTSI